MFLEIAAYIFITDIGLQFSSLVMSFSGFGITIILDSQNELESVPSSSIYGKNL